MKVIVIMAIGWSCVCYSWGFFIGRTSAIRTAPAVQSDPNHIFYQDPNWILVLEQRNGELAKELKDCYEGKR